RGSCCSGKSAGRGFLDRGVRPGTLISRPRKGVSVSLSRLVSFAMVLGLLVGSIPFFVASAGGQVTTVGENGAGVAKPDGTLPGDPQVQLVKVADGLIDPINVATANDGSGRVFILERVGYVRILDADGNLLEEPFLDIRNFVKI